MDREARMRVVGGALLVAAACLVPLCLRGAVIAAKLGRPGPGDAGGLISDLAVGVAFAALLILFARVSRLLTAAALAAWALLHYANYENALALDALASAADLRFLGDQTFLRGSALWVSSPGLLAAVMLGGATLGWIGSGPNRRSGGGLVAAAGLAGASVLLFVLHGVWLSGTIQIGWRYANFLQANASRLVASMRYPELDVSASTAMTLRLPELLSDLDGEPIVSLASGQGSRRNVLLVFVEGMSGGFLPASVRAHDTFVGPHLPRLNETAKHALRYDTFIVHQRRTNRGLYAGLCGELPNLLSGMPKMTAYIDSGQRVCLPHVLRGEGYRTVYLQAAPLAFMLKDQFMPKAGFDEVHGHDWFETAYVRSVWGIDDRAYFEQGLGMIDELRKGDSPWFLTMLTVGTHHPTIVPHDFEPHKPIRFSRAISYADQALDAFIRGLEERGVLDDTLVLITSDESRGVAARRDKTTAALTQNWGMLVALLPGQTEGHSTMEPFGLADLPISILDYLGIADRGAHFFGRSVFRHYDRGRWLFFGNTNLDIVGALTPDGSMIFCPDSMIGCRRYELDQGRLFSTKRKELRWKQEEGDLIRDIAHRSVAVHGGGVRPQVFDLVTTPDFDVLRPHDSLIHGGQYIDMKKGQWIEVEIEFEVNGGEGHEVEFGHYVRTLPRDRQAFHKNVGRGRTMRLRYTFTAPRNVKGVRCRSFAKLIGPDAMSLSFHRARMTLHTVGTNPGPGLIIHENETFPTVGSAPPAS
ncbi:MAG: LTA synthase family protein [Deltaproteobacteria bacterium]|nr:LTA synthase family protein [Deltaproteobacteria bacterium]